MRLPDIRETSIDIRVQYLALIGHMARIDGKFDETEISLLEKMFKQFGITKKYHDNIFQKQAFSQDKIEEIFAVLKNSQLHHSFMLDLIAMAMADGVVLESEWLMLSQIASLAGLRHEEFHRLINFSQATSNLDDTDYCDPMFQYVIDTFFDWARQKDVRLYKQTTFALNNKVDSSLKKSLSAKRLK